MTYRWIDDQGLLKKMLGERRIDRWTAENVQDALRAVVGRVLGEVEQSGNLPGDHHFYITFKTRSPGVSIPRGTP